MSILHLIRSLSQSLSFSYNPLLNPKRSTNRVMDKQWLLKTAGKVVFIGGIISMGGFLSGCTDSQTQALHTSPSNPNLADFRSLMMSDSHDVDHDAQVDESRVEAHDQESEMHQGGTEGEMDLDLGGSISDQSPLDCDDPMPSPMDLSCGLNGNGDFNVVCTQGQWEIGVECNDPDLCINQTERDGTTRCGLNQEGVFIQQCIQGQWQDIEQCTGHDLCTNGTEQTGEQVCGLNQEGVLIQECIEGQWQESTRCSGEDVCVNGGEQWGETLCGLNQQGVLYQVCREGEWQDGEQCSGQDVCINGQERDTSLSCGLAQHGFYLQRCTQGQWVETQECNALPACDISVVNQVQRRVEEWGEVLYNGLSETPLPFSAPEATIGHLIVGLSSNTFPFLSNSEGVFAAATQLGQGRIIAFSGQDFISSGTRSTLLNVGEMNQILLNAVQWVNPRTYASHSSPNPPPIDPYQAHIRTHASSINTLLSTAGYTHTEEASVYLRRGLWQLQDWRPDALIDIDVAIVQINEWGTLKVGPNEIESLRQFVMQGGGLILAGSALHWSWWLSDSGSQFIGNSILEGTEIEWRTHSVNDLGQVSPILDSTKHPYALLCRYLNQEPIQDSQLSALVGILKSLKTQGWVEELNQALTRLINEAPALPVSVNHAQARLSSLILETLPAHLWPAPHPWAETFPGLPLSSSNSPAEEDLNPLPQTQSIHTQWRKAQPLGLYLPPGETMQIEVSQDIAELGLSIQVGDFYDALQHISRIQEWRRAPQLYRTFPLNQTHLEIGSALGGPVYLYLPVRGENEALDLALSALNQQIMLTTQGGLPMLVYTLNESTAEEWEQRFTFQAPQVILQSRGGLRLVMARQEAVQVTQPNEILRFWTTFQEDHMELAQEPQVRAYESQWLFDPQVGWGYANASDRRINYPKAVDRQVLRTAEGQTDWWLFGHELGHQFQTSDWRGGDVTEVCVNLFTMYTLNGYIYQGGPFETLNARWRSLNHTDFEGYRWPNVDVFGKLQLYRQLVYAFGWEVYKDVFASYYNPDYPRDVYGSFMDGFAIRFSVISGRDLTSFFRRWEYPMSDEAEATIQGFGFEEWLPPGWTP